MAALPAIPCAFSPKFSRAFTTKTGASPFPVSMTAFAGPRQPSLRAGARSGFDEAGFLGAIGLSTSAGEKGRAVLEQLWARPTAEINGITGGYGGPGTKTVIPAEATAKLSFRLVPGQEPAKILAGFRRFVADRLPADAEASFAHEGGSQAVGFTRAHPSLSPPHALWKTSGARRQRSSAAAPRSRSSSRSVRASAWTRFLSASRSTTTAFMRRTRSTISRVSPRVCEARRIPAARRARLMRPGRNRLLALVLALVSSAGPTPAAERDTPGQFDYYALVFSWVPSYCRGKGKSRADAQCDAASRHTFLLHGLWPQHAKGWPADCFTGKRPWVPESVIASMRDIMPSRTSGNSPIPGPTAPAPASRRRSTTLSRARFTSASAYRRAFSPPAPASIADEIERAFLNTNPWLTPDMISITCRKANLLDIRVCFGRDLRRRLAA